MIKAATRFRWFINCYPPYLGAGIRVDSLSDDFRDLRVSMGLRWYNRNYVGTQFGGSLYSMIDPFYMLMLLNNLGSDYIVWDKSAEIHFRKPGTGRVFANFRITQEQLDSVRREADTGNAYCPTWGVDITDETGTVIAHAKKTLYIKKKSRET